MKKFFIFGTLIVVLAFLAGAAGLAYAQTQTPPQNGGFGRGMMGGWRSNGDGTGYGPGMMGGRGFGGMMGRGGMMGQFGSGQYGPMHEYMIAALETEFGLEAGELQDRIDQGQTPYEVAVELGFSEEEIQQKFTNAHTVALQAAVDAGVITQEQADWMSSHMQGMWGNGQGFGPGQGMGPGRGPCHQQGTQPNS